MPSHSARSAPQEEATDIHRAARRALIVLAAASGVLAGTGAAAGDCDAPGRSITLAFSGHGWSPELERDVRAQLAAGLAEHGLVACSPGAAPALARLELAAPAREQPIVVSVDDRVTDKRAERVVDVTRYRPGARALALAVSAEELLAASWIERAAAPAETGAAPAPKPLPSPEVTSMVQAGLRPRALRLGVAGAAAADRYGTGQTMIGGDLEVRVGLPASWRAILGVAGRWGTPRRVTGGEVDASALLGVAGVAAGIAGRGRLQLGVEAGVMAGLVTVSGRDATTGRTGRGAAVVARLGILGRWQVGAGSAFYARLWGGWSAAEVRAVHDGEVLGGVGSWGAGLSLGAELLP